MMMLSDTPAMLSFLPNAEASKRWSVVFSNEASMSTLSFIFATPKRVIPRTSPCHTVSKLTMTVIIEKAKLCTS